jgi:PAS domain S-box-containing protein
MRRRNRVVWKLSIAVTVIVTLVIVATGVANNIISSHYALKSARAVLRFNSASIQSGIKKLMMSRNNEGVSELIQDMARGSTVYRDVRIVAHYTGEVVVTRLDSPGAELGIDDRACGLCHEDGDPVSIPIGPLGEVVTSPDGTRILNVVTPIINETDCRTADCHAHDESGPILGILQAEYSLGEIDALISRLNSSVVLAALAAVLLGALALSIMFRQTLAKPIRYLLKGIQAIAGNELAFRFKTDRNDEIGLVAESFNDMAGRIQAHQMELRDAMEYLEGIVENSADLIITVNPNGLIQTVNRGAEQALGYQREELIGQRIETLFADPRERDIAIKRLQDQDNVTNFETRFYTKDKDIVYVLVTLSRLRDRDGNPIGTFGISKDITKEKELQARMVHSEKAAAIGQAVTSIQHAIKNMLNTLTGGSYLVRVGVEKENRERIDDGFEMIDEGISRIQSLSSSMLKYAKEWTVELEETDLAGLTKAVCSAIGQTAGSKGVELGCRISDPLPKVFCDPRLIHMALMDIGTNALDACAAKHYENGETASVECSVYQKEDDGVVVVAVKDNGIGMTEDVKANIFTPFFSTKQEWGTGLGLALTSRIIALHGGEIDLESIPGKGSTFRITLPVAGTNAQQGD